MAFGPITAKGKARSCGTRTSRTCKLGRTKTDKLILTGKTKPIRLASNERKLVVRIQKHKKAKEWTLIKDVKVTSNSKGQFGAVVKGKGLKTGLYRIQARVPQSSRFLAGNSRIIYVMVV